MFAVNKIGSERDEARIACADVTRKIIVRAVIWDVLPILTVLFRMLLNAMRLVNVCVNVRPE